MDFPISDIRQVINELKGWEKKYLPDKPQAGNIKLLDIVWDKPLKSVVSWLEWSHHQLEADKVKAEYTKIAQWVQSGNGVLSKNDDDNPFVSDEKGFRLQLTDLLRSIEENIEADFAIKNSAEAEQKASGKVGDIKNQQPAETGGNATLKSKIKDFLWTLYEKTLKVVVDAVMERWWPN